MTDRTADLNRIAEALRRAAEVLERHAGPGLDFEMKHGHGPVTAADREVDALLRLLLPEASDGWLSEESVDDRVRLQHHRVWIVDPVDGTRSLLAGRPEYSVSIALCEGGEPVLGGVCNPALGVSIVGGPGMGMQVKGELVSPFDGKTGDLRVLCSRSEWQRGEWQGWEEQGVAVRPLGSVAWKLALLAAGAADATWTLQPKSEWDVAAGAALVRAAGGEVWRPDGGVVAFNQQRPRFPCFAAAAAGHRDRVARLLADRG